MSTATDIGVDSIAEVCHEANRAWALASGENPAQVHPAWADTTDQIRESARIGVREALNGATPEKLHESWCETKTRDGWVYGPMRDNATKVHPCLCAYSELPESQRRKDALFQAIVSALR